MITLGIERVLQTPKLWQGRRIGLLAHPASVDGRLGHTLDRLLDAGADIRALFGPEHGFSGEAQDMEAVAGTARHPSGVPLVSLYGESEASLAPALGALSDVDVVIADLMDVGARYYTFVWTALLMLRGCARAGVDLVLADRPNPIGGAVEGAPQSPGYLSFVGLRPVANRHGLTPGELLAWAARDEGVSGALTVAPMTGWRRDMFFEETGLAWVMPSPNMPTMDTALVYPGMCLVEATALSEGRGTTRPFELVGGPGVESGRLAARLESMGLPGVRFRPASFKPGFQKHAGRVVGGVQLHVTRRHSFRPYRTGLAVLLALKTELGDGFAWRADPYEFVSDRPAIDLLTGGPWVREIVDAGGSLRDLVETFEAGEARFATERASMLIYPQSPS